MSAPLGSAATPSEAQPSLRQLLVRLAGSLFILLVCFVVLGLTLRAPLEAASSWFVQEYGLLGVLVSVTIVDTLPLTHEPILFLGYSGGLGFWPVWAAASTGSVLAGLIGWSCGRLLGRIPLVQRIFERYQIQAFLHRYGATAIAVAAITPIPYSLATWAAGASSLPFRWTLAGCMARLIKVWIYLSLIALGWSVGQPSGS